MVNSFVVNQTGAPAAIRVGDVLADSLRLFLARAVPFIGLSLIAYRADVHPRVGLFGRRRKDRASRSSAIFTVIIPARLHFARQRRDHLRRRAGITRPRLHVLGFAAHRIWPARPVIGLSLLVGILVTLAAILLLVPGIIVWCVYAVVVPVCVVETLGPTASMTRSSFLTKGNRWRIFGVFALIFIASLVVGAIVGYLAGITGGIRLVQVATFAIEAVIGAFNAVVVGVLYYQLRVAREGADIEKIASVFD